MHIPFAANASYPVRRGSRVRPLVDGVPAFRRICEAGDREHLGVDTAALGDREALALYRERARENARLLKRGADGDGIAFALDPREYARA
jgi:hypothetical protein